LELFSAIVLDDIKAISWRKKTNTLFYPIIDSVWNHLLYFYCRIWFISET